MSDTEVAGDIAVRKMGVLLILYFSNKYAHLPGGHGQNDRATKAVE